MNQLLRSSASALAGAIRSGEVSSEEVVGAHIKRIEEVNPRLNAVAQLTAESALARAREADRMLARGEIKGPLHGVPITIKDSLETRGVISTSGSKARACYKPGVNATAVERLVEAGAILLGKTNVPELTFYAHTDNLVYGRTNNPYDLSRTPGGSSGGEAAIIAACGSPLGLGSDAGGSQRVPAHFCGIATLRPTNGRVSRAGHFPPIEGLFGEVLAVGPMARYVEDLVLTLPLIAGADWRDPWTVPAPLDDPRTVELQNLRVAFYTDNSVSASTPEVIAAVKASASVLSESGLIVEEKVPDGLRQSFELYLSLMTAYANTEMEILLQSTGMDDIYPALKRSLETLRGAKPSLSDYVNMMTNRRRFQSRMLAFMRDYDVILCPAAPFPAPLHEATEEDQFIAVLSHAMPYGLTGWPAAVARAGSTPEGLPVGVQIVARPWREDIVLAVAQRLESAFRDWKTPTIFE
ncbi:MAG TPA: amidase [Blastocatellia bacterium]|nr:amidase [Blastocatellia bacterium]